MTPRRRERWEAWALLLKPWPLLIAGTAAIASGVVLLAGADRSGAGEELIIVGAVMLGGWMVLLASHGHAGRDDHDGDDHGDDQKKIGERDGDHDRPESF